MPFILECYPAFNYARDEHRVELNENGAAFISDRLGLQLSTRILLEKDVTGNGVVGAFALSEGDSVTVSVGMLGDDTSDYHPPTPAESEALFEETVAYWRGWLRQCTYRGRWREMVERSALVLKLLTYEPTGAIVAAPTCSLPEELGGERNWDYRYTWIRDAAFTLYALLRIGFTKEANRFMHWLEAQVDEREDWQNLQILYGIDGRRELDEINLYHLDGYRGSRPVRIGNGAYDQLQLDIYGELMDSVYLFNRYGEPISHEFLEQTAANDELGLRQLASGRRRHLGNPGRPPALRLFQADVLGDARPRRPSGRCAGLSLGAFQMDTDPRRNLRGNPDQRLEPGAERFRAAL